MLSSQLLNEGKLDLLISMDLSEEDEITNAIIDCFEAAQINVFDKPTVLDDWINPDVFEDLNWESDNAVQLSSVIWGHRVVISGEQIRIYSGCQSNRA